MVESKKVIPEGNCCYIARIFGKSSVCPSLDDAITMSPKCRKYNMELGWTVSGRILKCSECLKEMG